MIYVIDHKDSFTHNVVHQFSLYDEVECDNYNNINKNKLEKASVVVFYLGQEVQKTIRQHQKFIKSLKVKK